MSYSLSEQIKLTIFAVFIALCFAVGFFAGEGIAALSRGEGVPYANAAEAQGTSSSYVHIKTMVDGKLEERMFSGGGDGSIEVRVNNSHVEVNGVEIPFEGGDGESYSTSIHVNTNASGRDGEDGQPGKNGEDGKDGLPGQQAENNEAKVSDSHVETREESDAQDVYQFLNEFVAYVVLLFAY